MARRLDSGPESVFLYWKGRVALYALLKAMQVGEGDEVVMPAFTCVVVPNAVLYAGATARYVDIDAKTLNPSLEAIEAAVTEQTKVILVQNTFGLSTEVDRIAAFARERGIRTIEDCTHGFGGTFGGRPNGTWSDAAFYSTQWNKPFSTGLGGFAVVKDPVLRERLEAVNRELIRPGRRQAAMLGLLVRVKSALVNDTTYWPALRAYRALSRRGLVLGSSTGGEVSSTEMPEAYFRGAAAVQAAVGLRALAKLDALSARRRENGLRYNEWMCARGYFNYPDEVLPDHGFLKFPVFVRDRAAFLERAEHAKVQLGDWFCSMLHPVEGDLSPWGLDADHFPVARKAAAAILNLPTDTADPERVLAFLEREEGELVGESAFPGISSTAMG
ncbi:DegT/DnrJ/EryC1/StrS family aminotransferase [Thioalkalivibrio nitratireducens]|uniref:DegT/DnrJ/EryC1/StrS family aminotransferase n=1 Tax=Thioalkalivibrio nitratireducens TaxID=186931 RepID=UPI001F22B5A8|nr:DegT/DnrJ/EryC1/StrS family aminotransferase [Thioalkalivibrio nitratireducens]